MSEESNWLTARFGRFGLWDTQRRRKRKRKHDESSTNMDDFMIHQSKRPHIEFKGCSPFIPEQQLRFGLWNTLVSSLSQSKSNVFSTSRESFKKDESKEEISDNITNISLFNGQSSPIPVPKRPESPDLSISEGSNSSTERSGFLDSIFFPIKKRGSAESLSQSFESDRSKEDVINFKDVWSSPIGLWKCRGSSTSTESFESDQSKEEIITFKDGRSSPMLGQIRNLILQPGFIRTGEAI